MSLSSIPRFLWAVCLVLALVILWFARTRESEEAVPPATETVREPEDQLRILSEGTAWDPESDFQKRYGKDGNSIEQDLEIVDGILTHAVLLVKDFPELFLADNRDFTKLLMGKNKQRYAWVHPDHPSVSDGGELRDRWGTPLFFHRESARETTIRSAGEDREMWTSDDVLSGAAREER